MTPKEKAQELYDMFFVELLSEDSIEDIIISKENAYQVATCCVEQILSCKPTSPSKFVPITSTNYYGEKLESAIEYWLEVKEKLTEIHCE